MNSIPYIKVLLVSCFPFGFCCLLFLFWIAYKFFKKLDFSIVIERLLMTIAITFFYFQAPVINALAGLLDCIKIENEYYIADYPLEQCTNNMRYSNWRNILVFPTLSFFVIILPVCPLYYMYRNKHRIFSKEVIFKVGFLLNGYSPDTFFWYRHFIYFHIIQIFI